VFVVHGVRCVACEGSLACGPGIEALAVGELCGLVTHLFTIEAETLSKTIWCLVFEAIHAIGVVGHRLYLNFVENGGDPVGHDLPGADDGASVDGYLVMM